jgi:Glycosyltransferase Family 4
VRVALDATPLTISSGGLPRYVTELSVALAREFPDDIYSLISDQPFTMPERAPVNLVRGRPPHSSAERRWWLWGIQHSIRQMGAEVFHGTNFEVPYLGQTPAILTIHDLSPWREKSWHDEAGRVRRRTPWLLRLRRARMIVTVSDAVRPIASARFPWPLPACFDRSLPHRHRRSLSSSLWPPSSRAKMWPG